MSAWLTLNSHILHRGKTRVLPEERQLPDVVAVMFTKNVSRLNPVGSAIGRGNGQAMDASSSADVIRSRRSRSAWEAVVHAR